MRALRLLAPVCPRLLTLRWLACWPLVCLARPGASGICDSNVGCFDCANLERATRPGARASADPTFGIHIGAQRSMFAEHGSESSCQSSLKSSPSSCGTKHIIRCDTAFSSAAPAAMAMLASRRSLCESLPLRDRRSASISGSLPLRAPLEEHLASVGNIASEPMPSEAYAAACCPASAAIIGSDARTSGCDACDGDIFLYGGQDQASAGSAVP
mmetsp:Transcript_53313/g.155329  ORF Transcript_53313/g.155329 Transcript_53313/m.155329 type:complete len:214 (+) Transcript_53313:1377-2018(+)